MDVIDVNGRHESHVDQRVEVYHPPLTPFACDVQVVQLIDGHVAQFERLDRAAVDPLDRRVREFDRGDEGALDLVHLRVAQDERHVARLSCARVALSALAVLQGGHGPALDVVQVETLVARRREHLQVPRVSDPDFAEATDVLSKHFDRLRSAERDVVNR